MSQKKQDDFDLGALQPLALEPGVPYRMDEKPQFASPQSRMMPTMQPDENMEKYIGDVSYLYHVLKNYYSF